MVCHLSVAVDKICWYILRCWNGFHVLGAGSGFTETNYTQLTELYQKYRDKGQFFACCCSSSVLLLVIMIWIVNLSASWRVQVGSRRVLLRNGAVTLILVGIVVAVFCLKWNDKKSHNDPPEKIVWLVLPKAHFTLFGAQTKSFVLPVAHICNCFFTHVWVLCSLD